jgi:hypothetical protein
MRRVTGWVGFCVVTLASASSAADSSAPACSNWTAHCDGEAGHELATSDRERLEYEAAPALRAARACLDANGGESVSPAIVIRFDANGEPAPSKLEAGEHEGLPCLASVSGQLASTYSIRDAVVRCELRCSKTGAPPSAARPAPAQAWDEPAPRTKTKKIWYGWQTLIVDGVATGLVVTAFATKSPEFGWAGAGVYVLASPVVHWAHSNTWQGFASLGMRVLFPPAVLFVTLVGFGIATLGYGTGSREVDTAIGITAGSIAMAGPVIADAAGLAYETVEVKTDTWIPGSAASRRPATFRPRLMIAGPGLIIGGDF